MAPRFLCWCLAAAFTAVLATPVLAGSPAPDATLPPMARAQAERNATASRAGQFEPAPTPNQAVLAPRPAAVTGPVLSPSMFQPKPTYRGDGFTDGSSRQVAQDPKRLPLPGFSLKVPLN